MNQNNSPCDSRAEAISLLVAQSLSESESAELQQHLRGCESCQKRFEQTSAVGNGLRSLLYLENSHDTSKLISHTMERIVSLSKRESAIAFPTLQAAPISPKYLHFVVASLVGVACLLCMGLLRLSLESKPQAPAVVRESAGNNVGTVPLLRDTHPSHYINQSSLSTMYELRCTFNQSDETFESLLAKDSRLTFSVQNDVRSQLQEILE
jgi:hypothetical protein